MLGSVDFICGDTVGDVTTGRKRKAQPAGVVFTHGPILGFSPRMVDMLHWSRWNLTGIGAALPVKFHLDQLSGVGLRSPKFKKWSFTNMIALRGGSLARFLQNLQVYVRPVYIILPKLAALTR